VRLHHGLKQRRLGSEGTEQADFIDASFYGDQTRGRAAESMLRVDARCCLENSFASVHGGGFYIET
jgi:hypothetical protein